MFISTKTYGHDVGLSCAFRQWRADSHCRYLHGYALAFRFEFEAAELDRRNWVVDFGSLKSLKRILEDSFDHKTVVAEDDPELEFFREADRRGVLQLVVVPAGGCEMFARMVFEVAEIWLADNGYAPRVKLRSVEVREHGANSAMVIGSSARGVEREAPPLAADRRLSALPVAQEYAQPTSVPVELHSSPPSLMAATLPRNAQEVSA